MEDDMEHQLHIFEVYEKKDNSIWNTIPEDERQQIETIFINLLVKKLNEFSKEVNNNE